MRPFHYAFKVRDIKSTRKFYVELMGCKEGRSTDSWIDFDFFGNQLSAHISNHIPDLDYCGKVDGIKVPTPHFGCVLSLEQFSMIKDNLQKEGVEFIIPPQIRYAGKPEEQWTMFFLDLSGNPLEFKAFKNEERMFL